MSKTIFLNKLKMPRFNPIKRLSRELTTIEEQIMRSIPRLESTIDPNKCLPPELTIESVDDILYRIGLCFTSIRERPKRSFIDNPFIVFTIISLFLIERLITISSAEDNHQLFVHLACFGYFLGVRKEFDLFFIMCSLMVLISQLINFYNYRKCIKPTFLRVFQMMAGLETPQSLGLTNREEILKLLKTTRRLKRGLHFNSDRICVVMAMAYCLTLYLVYTQPYEVLFYGIPHSILFTLWVRYYWNLYGFQFMAFYIICLYLKFKFNALNERILIIKSAKRFTRIQSMIESIYSLILEINEYNTNYWSKFLLTFWLTNGVTVILYIYICVFLSMPLIPKLVMAYITVLLVITFLFLIFTASSVTLTANNTHKSLNSLFITYCKHNRYDQDKMKDLLFVRFRRKQKVFQKNEKFINHIKLSCLFS